ncbi:hypothetical protein VB620_04225 [Nodularia harveyana UHCC-0300]|uniref:Uncharacterized protein n=1 Tax=Nodularia harveyana UHCC-0300 TaxID=2974287 RepID=A0ABU5UAK0_9CYAN|nr:hypothetical protein [Nodularia harveyana]MEA5580547.1 hypothetical protein [Nodularia harveyana UHCC-0300]
MVSYKPDSVGVSVLPLVYPESSMNLMKSEAKLIFIQVSDRYFILGSGTRANMIGYMMAIA